VLEELSSAPTQVEPKSLLHKDLHRVFEEVRDLNLLQVMERERIASMGRRRRMVKR